MVNYQNKINFFIAQKVQKFNSLLQIALIICGTLSTALFVLIGGGSGLFSGGNKIVILCMGLSIIGSFASLILLCKKYNFLSNVYSNLNIVQLVLSLICTLEIIVRYLISFDGKIVEFVTTKAKLTFLVNTPIIRVIALTLFGIVIFFAIYTFALWLVKIITNKLCSFIQTLNKTDKVFLLVSLILGFVLLATVYSLTSAFNVAKIGEQQINNVIFNFDSANICNWDCFFYIGEGENDIRQVLFGILCLPFSAISHFVADVLFFIPNLYYIVFGTTQIMLIALTIIMLSKMINLRGLAVIPFYVLFFFSFSTLVFSLALEQYVLSTFYLVCFLYVYVVKSRGDGLLYLTSAGTLITSGIFFPLIINYSKPKKQWIKDLLYYLAIFFMVLFISGQFTKMGTAVDEVVNSLTSFGGKGVSFIDRIKQYFQFVCQCVLGLEIVESGLVYAIANTTKINIVGVIIFSLAILGFVVNYKNKFAKICGTWVLFSIILLAVVGYGSKENAMFLYGFYFAWAFIALIVMLIEKIFELIQNKIKNKTLLISKLITYSVITAPIVIFNIIQIVKIITFAINTYPIF